MTRPNTPTEGWQRSQAVVPAATNTTRPSRRSAQRRRLANDHQTARATVPTIGPRNQPRKWAIDTGATQAGTVMASHWRMRMTTPGQSRGRGSAGAAGGDRSATAGDGGSDGRGA